MYEEWRSLLARELDGHGVSAALEVGATSWAPSLLDLPPLASAEVRLGANTEVSEAAAGPVHVSEDVLPWANGAFDVVVSNATLEHSPRFWLAAAEMARVLKPGGLMAVGVPAFVEGAAVFPVHRYPVDCYRFGVDAVPALLPGLCRTGHQIVLDPARLLCWGWKD